MLYLNLSQGWRYRWQRIGWIVKQLLPLTYRSRYKTEKESRFCVWRMWFGRCFAIDDIIEK